LLLTALTKFLDLNDLIFDELFEALKSDSSLSRVIGIEDLSLKLLFSQISAPDAFTETFEFTVCELSVEQHIKLSEYLFNCSFQQLMHLLSHINKLNILRYLIIRPFKCAT
jgi:hypothetical protein